jgi:hypothetical protein
MRLGVASLLVALAATASRGVAIANSPLGAGEPRLVSPHSELGESAVASTRSTTPGWTSSITVGSDGLPLISYVHLTPTGLRVAHCANVLCVPHFRRR